MGVVSILLHIKGEIVQKKVSVVKETCNQCYWELENYLDISEFGKAKSAITTISFHNFLKYDGLFPSKYKFVIKLCMYLL